MSSPSSSASSASSASRSPFPAPDSHPAAPARFRSHASSDSIRSGVPGPAYDRASGRRRSTLSGSDRKRRLVSSDGDGDAWSRQPDPTVGSSSRVDVDSRSIHRDSAAGSSLATAIDLSSSPSPPSPPPPQQRPPQPIRQGSTWTQPGTGLVEYNAPRWQPDAEVTNCPICGTLFSFWYRKHHCRKCGRVVCASCSPHRITIPRQFIVHPPEGTRSRASSLIAPRPVQTIDLDGEDSAQSTAAMSNPGLGGGEEVRLCNPCVPDPNPEPPRGFALGDPRAGASWGAQGPPSHPRHRSYHSLSTPRNLPYGGITDPFAPRMSRRTVGSNDYPGFLGYGGSFGSRFHERPDYGSLPHSQFPPQVHAHAHASTRPFPSFGPATSSRSMPIGGSPAQAQPRMIYNPPFPHAPHIHERDLCPICDQQLPPVASNGNEEAREAHIRECIENRARDGRASPPQSGGSPASQPPLPVRMIAFMSTEKDCLGQDGGAQECTICMEDYEVGQPLVRLECLCKFHKRCIVEWFERKKECPVHKVS